MMITIGMAESRVLTPNVAGEPSVSVIIPAYNAENFVLDAVRSVLRQDYPVLEILLVDDGSLDGTVELVRREAPQVQIIQQANAGAAAARNTGMRHARGEFICFLDADDGWFPGKLLAQSKYLALHPTVGAVFHGWTVWKADESGAYPYPKIPRISDSNELDRKNSGWIYPLLLLNCIVHTSTFMIRRRIAQDVGFFDTDLRTGEDYDYWLRVSRQCEIHKLAATFSFYRELAGSLTSTPRPENNEYRVLVRAIQQWGLSSPDGGSASASLVQRRLGKLAFDFGHAHYRRGSLALAQDAFGQAMRHDPLHWRAAAYYMLSTTRRLAARS